MADFLRNMDPAHRAFLAIFIAVILKSLIAQWWERFKEREALKPVPMKMRKGVFVPNGVVDRIQRAIQIVFNIWIVWMIVVLGLLAYMKIMGWERLF